MTTLTLNTKNLDTHLNELCHFCGEGSPEIEVVVSKFNERRSCICFSCIEQLAKLIKKS